MKSAFKSGAVAYAPSTNNATSEGNPTQGAVGGDPTTIAGDWWFYAVTREILNVIIAAGLQPSNDVDQLKLAIQALIPNLATNAQHTQDAPPADVSATPSGVKAVIDQVIDSSPGALDTLNELAAALGDDENFSTTVTNSLALKAPLNTPAFTGNPTVPTQAAGNDSLRAASTAFVQREIGSIKMIEEDFIYFNAAGVMITNDNAGTLINLTGVLDDWRFINVIVVLNGDPGKNYAPVGVSNLPTTRQTAITVMHDDSPSGGGTATLNIWRDGNNLRFRETVGNHPFIMVAIIGYGLA